jgi:hypothetical protein
MSSQTPANKKLRRRKCKICKQSYQPRENFQKVCSPGCAVNWVREEKLRKEKADARRAKANLRNNDRQFRLKQAQTAFNAFIRLRDDDKPCISCGRYHAGQYHAGHYIPVGRQAALRFNEINCHRQCAPCNNHKSGNLTGYREELVRRIGLPLVEWLEKDHPSTKAWSCEELKAIEAYYKRAAKEMYASPEHTPFPF